MDQSQARINYILTSNKAAQIRTPAPQSDMSMYEDVIGRARAPRRQVPFSTDPATCVCPSPYRTPRP